MIDVITNQTSWVVVWHGWLHCMYFPIIDQNLDWPQSGKTRAKEVEFRVVYPVLLTEKWPTPEKGGGLVRPVRIAGVPPA